MGIIYNIQHFSVHDGPGIRTVIFEKGCPLRCKWCANPESQRPFTEMGWTGGECIGCGQCTEKLKDLGCRFENGELNWDTEIKPDTKKAGTI